MSDCAHWIRVSVDGGPFTMYRCTLALDHQLPHEYRINDVAMLAWPVSPDIEPGDPNYVVPPGLGR